MDQAPPKNFIVRISDSFRNYVKRQNSNPKTILRSYSVPSYLIYNTLPIVTVTTLLAPLSRLKLLYQIEDLRIEKFESGISIFKRKLI